MSRTVGAGVVGLLCVTCLALGAGGMRMWEWVDYTRALESERAAIGQRDKLVGELATAKAERDKAQQDARAKRQAIYDKDPTAKAWASKPVPAVLAQQLRDAAKAADAASRPKRATGVQATTSGAD